MEEKEFDLNNKKIFYRVIGNGPPVILLHGFGEAGWVWTHQFNTIGDFQFVVPDLPGSGRSEMIDDMSMEGLAEAIYELLKHLGIEQCTMIGHSMGGYVTLAFAEKYSSMLDSFGLFHSTALADTEERKGKRKEAIEHIEENGAISFLKGFVSGLYGSSTKAANPSMIEKHIEAVSFFTKAALTSYCQSMMQRPDRSSILKQNKMPVLFVLGREDTAIPFYDVLKLASIPDIVYIHILEKSGHMGMVEEPDKSSAIIKKFLLKTI